MASTSSATKTAAAESRPAGGDRSGDPALELVAELAAAGQRLVFRQGDDLNSDA